MNPYRHEQPDRSNHLPWGTRIEVKLRADYPVLLAIAAAASAAGAGLSMAGNAKANDEMDDRRTAELLRQKGYQKEADAIFDESLDKSSAPLATETIEEGAAQRQNAYNNLRNATASLTTQPGQNQPVGESASGAGARLSSNVAATNQAWSNLQGAAQSKLGGYQDWGLARQIKDTRANQDLGITATKARHSASVLPLEMQDASQAGDGLKAWGSLASALGMVAGMGAAVGAAGAAGAAAPAAGGGSSAMNVTPEMLASWGAFT